MRTLLITLVAFVVVFGFVGQAFGQGDETLISLTIAAGEIDDFGWAAFDGCQSDGNGVIVNGYTAGTIFVRVRKRPTSGGNWITVYTNTETSDVLLDIGEELNCGYTYELSWDKFSGGPSWPLGTVKLTYDSGNTVCCE